MSKDRKADSRKPWEHGIRANRTEPEQFNKHLNKGNEMDTIYVLYEVDTNEVIMEGTLEQLEAYDDSEYGICTKECFERGVK